MLLERLFIAAVFTPTLIMLFACGAAAIVGLACGIAAGGR